MLKYLVALLIVIALLVSGFFWLNAYIYDEKQGGAEDYKKVTLVIDGKPIVLGTEGTQYFGNQAKGDMNDDGIVDLAFLITQSGGGSGTFFYAVAALQNAAGRYIGTNAVFLGDRIAPQSTEIRHGILVINYADRGPGEPFSVQPSVGTSMYVYFDGVDLIGVPPTGPISIEGTTVCLPPRYDEEEQTLECALGLRDDTGRHFALLKTDAQSDVPSNARVRIEGDFKLHLGSNYLDVGRIEVTKITPL